MFIVIIGTKASGKETVTSYLTATLGFTRLYLTGSSSKDKGAPDAKTDSTAIPAVDSELIIDDIGDRNTFDSAKELLQNVTPRWRRNYVTTDVINPVDLYLLWKRPFVLVVGIDAPTGLRYRRHCSKLGFLSQNAPNLEDFVAADDNVLYSCCKPLPPSSIDNDDITSDLSALGVDSSIGRGLAVVARMAKSHSLQHSPVIRATADAEELNLKRVLAKANVSISNSFPTVTKLYEYLDKIDLTNGERLRPSWDTYFMLLSELASHRANCMKRRVGCILVKDNQIIATGYNGTPKGVTNCNEGGCPRCNAGTPCGVSLDHCLCIHAEENALLEAGRGRVCSADDVVLYCNTCPCLGCAKKIVQVGVKVVVYSKGYGMDDLTLKLFDEAKVKVRQHTPPTLSMGIGSR
ncbi:Deoxycytidine monophosphate (dCMP) deaminase [Coemansia sp. RSA 988]|nr:Deoxycytidine monophosphate (dCMP) deaminase [Coemansia sp. RSA 988]